MILYDTPQS